MILLHVLQLSMILLQMLSLGMIVLRGLRFSMIVLHVLQLMILLHVLQISMILLHILQLSEFRSTALHTVWILSSVSNSIHYIYIYMCIYIYILRCFKRSDDAFRLSYSIAFDCSIRPFSDLFHSWLYIFHLSRFSGDGLVFSCLQVSSES